MTQPWLKTAYISTSMVYWLSVNPGCLIARGGAA